MKYFDSAFENDPALSFESSKPVQFTANELVTAIEQAAIRGTVEGGIILDTLRLCTNSTSMKKLCFKQLRQIGIEKERAKSIVKAYVMLNTDNLEDGSENNNTLNTEVLELADRELK